MKSLLKYLQESFLSNLLVILTSVLIISGGVFWFQSGLPSSHDAFAHITYAKIFFQALQEGQFPVRWVDWVQNGYSMPLFNFYQVGFYYLTALFFVFLPSVFALKITVYLLWIVSTFFIFLLSKKYGVLPASTAALLYGFAPYLILDIFIRGSFPEFTVISLLPVLLWLTEQLLQKSKAVFGPMISLVFGLMIISHLPATIICLPVILGFSLLTLYTAKVSSLPNLGKLTLSFIIGVTLAAFYLLPALFELKFININDLTKQAFDFHKNFSDPLLPVSYIWGYNGSWWGEIFTRSISLGLLSTWILVSSLAVAIWIICKKLSLPILNKLIFWLGVACYGYFFTFKGSLLFWEHLEILRFIQFPWRFLMVLPIAQALLGAAIISLLNKKHQIIFTAMIFMATLFFSLPFLQPQTFFEEKALNAPLSSWPLHKLTREEAFIEPGYMPKGVNELPEWDSPKWTVTPDQAIVRTLSSTATNFRFAIDTLTPITFTINTHQFPGWRVQVDGQDTVIREDSKYHFLGVQISPGSHIIEAKLQNTPIRSWSNYISLAALGIIILELWVCFPSYLASRIRFSRSFPS
ncbi:hypothetical protein A2631_03220 [Candidatus Daviesbacteria bacterium RIFCSPHIGHO2_01_FULL_44_29]|uniref:Membrane protein 6-pyruvoyl-tetrahydropterin synthase-related domain-containing protein n=1 Tax=Candidatus Daviesbacteria bacterium RIFCSPHIGHO2_02_FULL_43_12 TaxID=1797776 RepID=A0A1F5KKS2_9BACT|nr:MAG: hypothetical protein A2631_03220 [Candidatus Daviesbacteria bacterium RIFCSPHIGHO2_01_FULL_44_29]OGE40305.1 MAG: hypothetical protein A3E86_03865 [Candidatus Daviesbacteria bacterium RIFCSPHIGHO2_12_FULL_47_45]OGE41395.1 MAG: hypothetical protein A3D25_02615 [Candidatus Daviesbacteria bacterium RIFCSPHIGHO2_02_FULL_43_12]OGE69596.1 MAG: hypothetical protein A3B55_04360 [Candidatus Daviesbacteria bacterium RIFCSPLOWO2_01_FULL_43_15]